MAKTEERTKSIEAKLRTAREEIYREQEESRRGWVAEQTDAWKKRGGRHGT